MLAEKYRPKKVEEIVGNEEAKKKVREWIEAWLRGKRQKPLLIHGPVGVGKTSMAYAIAKQFGFELIVLSPSEKRNKASLQEVALASTSPLSVFGRPKMILIDDIEGLSREDRGAMSGVVELISKARVPVIITTNDLWDKKIAPLRSKAIAIQMKKVSPTQVLSLLKKIVKEEGLKIPEDDLKAIAKNSDGDVRAAINDLEGRMLGYRDRKSDVFKVMRAIFKSETLDWPRREIFNADVDLDMLKAWVDENIAEEYEKLQEIAKAYDILSRADVFQGRISRRQYWGLLRYVSAMLSAVSLAKEKPYRKFTKYRFPSYIRELSASYAKRAKLREICKKIGKKIHLSPKEVREDIFLYANLILRDKDSAKHYYHLTDEDLRFLKNLVGG